VGYIFSFLQTTEKEYAWLCRLCTLCTQAKRWLCQATKHRIVVFRREILASQAAMMDDTPRFTHANQWVNVVDGRGYDPALLIVPDVRTDTELLIFLCKLDGCAEAEELWLLLRRVELSRQWQRLTQKSAYKVGYCHRPEKMRVFRDEWAEEVFYFDPASRQITLLSQHPRLRHAAPMSATTISQFVKSFDGGGYTRHLPPNLDRLRGRESAERFSHYFDAIKVLVDAGTGDDIERFHRFHPRLSTPEHRAGRMDQLVLCLDARCSASTTTTSETRDNETNNDKKQCPARHYTHLYSSAPAMVEFRRNLYHTAVGEKKALPLIKLFLATQQCPDVCTEKLLRHLNKEENEKENK
jgi:hypothetical protein